MNYNNTTSLENNKHTNQKYSKNTSRKHLSGANVLLQFHGNTGYHIFLPFLKSFSKLLSTEIAIAYCAPISLIHSITLFALEAAIIISTNKAQRSCGFTDRWLTVSTNGWQKNCRPAAGRISNA